MKLDHRTGRSIYSVVLQALIRPFKPHLVAPKRTFPAGSPRLEYDKKIRGGVTVVERQQEDIWLYDIFAAHDKNGDDNDNNKNKKSVTKRKRMYYIAGGGWQSPPSGQHWKFCAELVRKVPGLVVTIVSAPLAPVSPAATTLPALGRLFASVLGQGSGRDDGEQVILAGDSSGANIVLSLALNTLSKSKGEEEGAGTRQPVTLLVISPAVDLRQMEAAASGQGQALTRRDPVLTVGSHNSEAAAWAQGLDRTDVCISPAVADAGVLAVTGVRLVGVTGGHDILTPAALGFRDACARRGVSGAWLHWEGQMHCFPLAFMYGLPEAVRAKDWVVEQIRGL